MRRLGIQVDPTQARLRNVAAVVVTATIPAFVREGSRLDITVSSMGNAKWACSRGGVLMQTPAARGADRKTVRRRRKARSVVGGFSWPLAPLGQHAAGKRDHDPARVPDRRADRTRDQNYLLGQRAAHARAAQRPDFGTAAKVSSKPWKKAFGTRQRARARRRLDRAEGARRAQGQTGRAFVQAGRGRRGSGELGARRDQRAHRHHRRWRRRAPLAGSDRTRWHHDLDSREQAGRAAQRLCARARRQSRPRTAMWMRKRSSRARRSPT